MPGDPLSSPADLLLGRTRFASVPGASDTLAGLRGLLREARNEFIDPLAEQTAVEAVRRSLAERVRVRAAAQGGSLGRAGAAADLFSLGSGEASGLLARESLAVRRRLDAFKRRQGVLQILGGLTRAGFQGSPLEALIAGRAAIEKQKIDSATQKALFNSLSGRDALNFAGIVISALAPSINSGGGSSGGTG